MAEPRVEITEAATLAALPPAARALFGQDAFSTLAWYGATAEAALPAGATPCFQVAAAGGRVLAVLPMLRRGRALAALTTPYTCLWRPLLLPGLTAPELLTVGRALAPSWRRAGVVRLDAMPSDDSARDTLLDGLTQTGLRLRSFDHFGNWYEDVAGLGWEAYLAKRTRRLRSAVTRQTRRAQAQPGFAFELVSDTAGLGPALAAYDAVYAASWKRPEPYPHFNAALMQACAAEGSLRLGVLRFAGLPAAAQLWLVHGTWAGVLKLAYDEAFKALAPGNVLSALMLRHILDQDEVREIDYGRGDDDYKAMWATSRRQRIGMLVINPASPTGLVELARHALGRLRSGRRSLAPTAAENPEMAGAPP